MRSRSSRPDLLHSLARLAARLWQPRRHGSLKARAKPSYSGLENRLYRVEIHSPGSAGDATFKWSRNSGSNAVRLDEALPIVEGVDRWIDLEAGIQISFQPAPPGRSNIYRAGDSWSIPARAATGDVDWPGAPDNPETRRPAASGACRPPRPVHR